MNTQGRNKRKAQSPKTKTATTTITTTTHRQRNHNRDHYQLHAQQGTRLGRGEWVREEGGARREREGGGVKETQENEMEIRMKLQFTSNSFAPICTHTRTHI